MKLLFHMSEICWTKSFVDRHSRELRIISSSFHFPQKYLTNIFISSIRCPKFKNTFIFSLSFRLLLPSSSSLNSFAKTQKRSPLSIRLGLVYEVISSPLLFQFSPYFSLIYSCFFHPFFCCNFFFFLDLFCVLLIIREFYAVLSALRSSMVW